MTSQTIGTDLQGYLFDRYVNSATFNCQVSPSTTALGETGLSYCSKMLNQTSNALPDTLHTNIAIYNKIMYTQIDTRWTNVLKHVPQSHIGFDKNTAIHSWMENILWPHLAQSDHYFLLILPMQ